MFSNANKSLVSRAMCVGLTACGACSALAQPNIEVRIDSVVQSIGQEVTYEPIDVGQSIPLIIVVRNTGFADLQFPSETPVFAAGGFSDQFSVVQPPLEAGNRLSPNGSTAFRVDFTPTLAREVMQATINIPTNDPDTPMFILNVRGRVHVPKMVVRHAGVLVAPDSQVNLPPARVGEESQTVIVVQNEGTRPLTLTGPADVFGGFGANAFSTDQVSDVLIEAGQSHSFAVFFSPSRTGAVTANIGMSSNDVGSFPNGRFMFVVRGVGQQAAAPPPIHEEEEQENPADEDEEAEAEDANDDDVADEDLEGANQDVIQDEGTNGASGEEQQNRETEAEADLAGRFQEDAGLPLCGFGMPLGLACCVASLSTTRVTRRRHR